MFGIAWLATIWGRLAMYGAIVALAFLLLRWYSNKAFNAGFEKGKVQGSEDMIKAHEKEWEAAQKALDAQKQELAVQQAKVGTDRNVEIQNRKVIVSTLEKGNADLSQQIQALTPAIQNLPASQIDPFIRKALAELRQ